LSNSSVTYSGITQTGYPEQYPYAFGFTIDGDSQCKWCPDSGSHDACGLHRQSPIDLKRSSAIIGGPDEKDCPDWHRLSYKDDTCTWNDIRDHLSIERHALQISIPQLDTGEIDCLEMGLRKYPRLDYSKGFPDFFWLQRIDISVPSQHIQEGIQYAAEVSLNHFYEIAHEKNQVRALSTIFLRYCGARLHTHLRYSFRVFS
jgi:hypothetical protein